MQKKSVAVFGSAFNPPHRGHEDVILQATQIANSVLVVPSYRHAFGKIMAPFDARMKMTKLLVEAMGTKKPIQVLDIERHLCSNLEKTQPLYTFDLLEAIEISYPDSSLKFVVGPDNAEPHIWERFYRSQEIIDRWGIWVAQENIAIRSSKIRSILSSGGIVSEDECPASVLEIAKKYYCDSKNK